MRRGPVQDRTIPLQKKNNRSSQRLGASPFQSYFSFFMISCRGEQRKPKKRRPSPRKEKDQQRQRLLTLFLFPSRLLRVWEAWNPQYEGSLKIEKGGQGFRKSLPPLPGQDRWEGAISSKGHNQSLYLFMYVHLCFRVGPLFLLLIRPFQNLSSAK